MAAIEAVIRVFSAAEPTTAHFKGSAFFVSPRDVLTCHHVVQACGERLWLQIGSECLPVPATQWVRGETTDLVWLHLTVDQDRPAMWLESAWPEPEVRLNLLGFDGCENTQVSRHTQASGESPHFDLVQLQGSVAHGMSGGPVLNDTGRVVGVTVARDTDRNVAYAIPTRTIFQAFPELQTALLQAQPWAGDQAPLVELASGLFVGRESQLAELASALLPPEGAARQPVAVTALHGMGGVGKSWLIRHFVQQHQARFPGGYLVMDLNPDNPLSEDQALDQLAEQLGVKATKAERASAMAQALRLRPALLHLENADSEEAVAVAAVLAQRLKGCALVVVGRIDNMGVGAAWRRVAVKPFTVEEGVAQLKAELVPRAAPLPAEGDMRRLVQTLGGLPLAIHLAAASLAYDAYSVEGYLADLARNGLALLAPVDAADPRLARERARAVVRSSFELSLSLLRRRWSTEASAAVESVAALTLAPIEGVKATLAHALMGQPPQGRSWRFLAARYGLLQQTRVDPPQNPNEVTEPFRWSMHPLVAEHWRCQWPADGTAQQTTQERLTDWFVAQIQQEGMAEARNELSALGDWLLRHVPEGRCIEVERLGSRKANEIGPYRAWLTFCQRLVANPLLNEEERSNALFTLATVSRYSGDLDTSLDAARAKQKLDLGRGDEREAALAAGQIADILAQRGDLDEALRIRKDVQLPVMERLGDVREVAITQGKIADILAQRGDLEEALRIRKDVQLPVLERLGDVRSVLVARVMVAQLMFLQDQRAGGKSQAQPIADLMALALADARRLGLPEAGQIEGLQRAMGLAAV